MPSFMEASRSAMARMGRHLADRLQFERVSPMVQKSKFRPVAQYRQPLRIIPGMTAAYEPCCLAQRWSDKTHPIDAAAQLKVDGVRALHIDTSIVTREAIPLDCALHCLPSLHELEKLYGRKMVFDSEYQEPEGFQATLAAMKAGVGVGTIWLFDAVPYDEWRANKFTERLDDRVGRMCELARKIETPFMRALDLIDVPTPPMARGLAAQGWARGGEGIVVKSRSSRYFRGKSPVWQKLKKRQTFDGPIVDALIKEGRCVSIMVKMPADSPHPGKVVRIGSGIPSELREALARDITAFEGVIAEIGFNDSTDTGALRGGYFIRMRPDKGGN